MLKQLKQRELRVEVGNVAKDGILKTLDILRKLKTLRILKNFGNSEISRGTECVTSAQNS